MNLQSPWHNVARFIFLGTSTTTVPTFQELFAHFFSVNLIGDMYPAGRLLEFAATLLVFVIVVILSGIRDELRLRAHDSSLNA